MIPYLKLENVAFSHAQKKSLVSALSGKYYLTQGKLSYPWLEENHPAIQSTYELKRRCIKVVSFKDDSRAFDPHACFYSQRFNSFAADGTVTVWEYLMEAGYSEYEKAHVDLIKKTGVFELQDLERIKLSSGQSRKLLITSAILQQPKLLIIDNPYMGLDAKSRTEFNDLLDDLVEHNGIQLILAGQYDVLPTCISHELELENLKIKYEGRVRKSEVISKNIKTPPPFGKHFTQLSPKELDNAKQAFTKKNQANILKKIQPFFKTPNNNEDWTSIFSLKNTTVAYYGKKVLDNINWRVKQGEKWALFGANGSGKSTLLSLLFGDHPQAYANEIYLFDQKRGVGQNIWDIKKRTGYTSSELHYFFNTKLTAEHAIITGLFDHVYLKRPATTKEQAVVDLLMEYFDVLPLKERFFQQLSTGEQRILLLIRALVKNPPLILLDEPFQGFDLATIQKAKVLLNTILSEKHTLVFITHYEREIPKIVTKRFVL